jgi:hypothetical protein
MHNFLAQVIIFLRFHNKKFHTFALEFTHMKTLQFEYNFFIRSCNCAHNIISKYVLCMTMNKWFTFIYGYLDMNHMCKMFTLIW